MPKKIVFLGYIDPGTGGLVLQWLIGVAVGSLFFFGAVSDASWRFCDPS